MDDDLIRRINKIERERRRAPKRDRILRNIAYVGIIIGGMYCAWYNANKESPKKGGMRMADTAMVDTSYIQKPVDTGNVYVW